MTPLSSSGVTELRFEKSTVVESENPEWFTRREADVGTQAPCSARNCGGRRGDDPRGDAGGMRREERSRQQAERPAPGGSVLEEDPRPHAPVLLDRGGHWARCDWRDHLCCAALPREAG